VAQKYFRVSHHTHFDLVAEFFNLFNHTNIIGINPFFGSALLPLLGFGQPIEAVSGRPIEVLN
jgi:hypothetical protein